MSQMLYYLPPLSPDYSGVASVFHDLQALTVIHDAAGCTGTYTGYDEPRWFGSASPTFCSGLREMDAVMGDDEKLVKKIEAALKHTHAPCVAVVGSPVPMVVGFDFKGFAAMVERRTGLPVFGFPTTGLGYYDQGQRDAYLAVAKRVLPDTPPRNPRSVNILGASALDGFDETALDALEDLLGGAGFRINACWGARSPLEELKSSGGAEFNWVVTAAALPLARYLQERYGVPFVTGLPIGKHERDRILSALSRGGDETSKGNFPPPSDPMPGEETTLIIGEALFCSSLRAFFEAQGGGGRVKIATFFPEGRDLLRPGDEFFTNEDEAIRALADPALKEVIADPLIRDLLPEAAPPRFTGIPHRAVSGRIYNKSMADFFGPEPDIPGP
ncbi:MAG: nitrogenase component 1 [Treponema sp.]|jgi:hypothetical protein|nr:nitrogenase component 1 [Treponema sp.]